MLYFACRHHVDELVIGGVYAGLFNDPSGPCPELFEGFRNDWHLIDQVLDFLKGHISKLCVCTLRLQPFENAIFTRNVYIHSLRDDIASYIETVMADKNKKCELRSDCFELLQLRLVVLGKPLPNYVLHTPHACSNPSRMAKIIYTLKMDLFRGQLTLSRTDVVN